MPGRLSPLKCATHHKISQRRRVLHRYPAKRVLITWHVLHEDTNKIERKSNMAQSLSSKSFACLPLYTGTQPATSLVCRLPSRSTTPSLQRRANQCTASTRVGQNTSYMHQSSGMTLNYHFNTFVSRFWRSNITLIYILPLSRDSWRTMRLQATVRKDSKLPYLTLLQTCPNFVVMVRDDVSLRLTQHSWR